MRTPRLQAGVVAFAAVVSLSLVGPAATLAAGPPVVLSSTVDAVTATSATLHAQINPDGLSTTYRFEYLTEVAYQANLASEPSGEGFQAATLVPVSGAAPLGSGTSPTPTGPQQLSKLSPSTTYRYRVVARNSAGPTMGPTRSLGTEAPTNVFTPLDHRGWELVSPPDKGGGAIAAPGALRGGGAIQAAENGQSITYGSSSSFTGGAGAPGASQYLSGRGEGGWSTADITTPALSGSYGDHPDGVPYRFFSEDLADGLLLNGERCRGEGSGCPVANPPLPVSGAPSGYQNYYLRADSTGAYQGLVTAADLAHTALGPSQFELKLAGANPELNHVILATCAALTAGATEIAAAGGGCEPEDTNLYAWSEGRLELVNLLSSEPGGPFASLPAQSGAVSTNGSRIYWSLAGNVTYLREGGSNRKIAEGGEFQTATPDGSLAFYVKNSHLFRYNAINGETTEFSLAPASGGGAGSGELLGLLGVSDDGSYIYYVGSNGALYLRHNGTDTEIAAAVAASDYPPATGTARVSADGTHLLFASSAELAGYENRGAAEIYLYDASASGGAGLLTCVSCKPTGEPPEGGSTIPGAVANGSADFYKPRVLSANGRRVFFDSEARLSIQDTDNRPDVYEWEAGGEGTCGQPQGCVQLISSGRSPEPSTFLDASANGSDVFFLTAESLVPTDPGSIDVYDDREGGGFPVPEGVIPCDGDACQALPGEPEDPTPGTLVPNSGNPPVPTPKTHHKKKRHHRKKGRHRHHHKRHQGRTGKANPPKNAAGPSSGGSR